MTDLYPARLPNREQRAQMILLRAESQRAHLAACQAEDRGDRPTADRWHDAAFAADDAIARIYEAAMSNGPQAHR